MENSEQGAPKKWEPGKFGTAYEQVHWETFVKRVIERYGDCEVVHEHLDGIYDVGEIDLYKGISDAELDEDLSLAIECTKEFFTPEQIAEVRWPNGRPEVDC